MNKFKDFYDTLVENLKSYNGEYESFINHGPNLFKLLCDLLNHEIDDDLRLPVCGAIAYYVAPVDIIPEQSYGPYGYIDDIYMSVYILRKVADKHGYGFIQNVWSNNTNIELILDECEEKTTEILKNDEIENIINYVGLKI